MAAFKMKPAQDQKAGAGKAADHLEQGGKPGIIRRCGIEGLCLQGGILDDAPAADHLLAGLQQAVDAVGGVEGLAQKALHHPAVFLHNGRGQGKEPHEFFLIGGGPAILL